MKPTEIESFLAIVQFGNLTKAAHSLFISQSTLSQRLKALEDELEITLLKRKKGQDFITLTPAGDKFYKIAKKFERLAIEAKEIKTEQEEDTLIVGAVDSIHNFVLPSIYNQIKKKYPKTKLVLKTHQSDELYTLIEKQEIDIGFSLQERVLNRFSVKRMFEEKMVLVKKRGIEDINIIHNSDLDPEYELYVNWGMNFRSWHEKWWGIEGTRGIQVDTASLMMLFLKNPRNWAIVPISMAKQFEKEYDVSIYPLYDEAPNRICYAVFPKDSEKLPIIENCILNRGMET
ncbi:LysR family transcriptional regulator [Ornithinibacillus halophilus]|uniref:DNA-binding transcriptional regulator, LysR family n=1 Tax=Ornithinibacillus halophilus TaxID=930117 RepID=A0A1M5GM63_9BACI|nr:LysR family transcriptional regulator [Ornithinibacillus halophilus]SHG04829.1 DNA-binding transcriptional regulator, LysR family [Ornithinibacillus halophilus]